MKTLHKQIPLGWIIVLIAVLIQLLVSFKIVQAAFNTEQVQEAPGLHLDTPATSLISTTTSHHSIGRAPQRPFPWQGILPDTDRDGIPNRKDKDIDNDGLPNGEDPNVDGSVNSQLMWRLKPAVSSKDSASKIFFPHVGDLFLNNDPRELDIDGDGFLDTDSAELDIDGDFQRDTALFETDIDGDAIPDVADDDIDGDGLLNAADPDRDGDAIPNALDSDPAGLAGDPLPCKAPPLIPARPVPPPTTTLTTPTTAPTPSTTL